MIANMDFILEKHSQFNLQLEKYLKWHLKWSVQLQFCVPHKR